MDDDFGQKYRTWHARISYLKSAVRLVGCVLAGLAYESPALAVLILAGCFAAAEVLGILEEWI